MGPFKGGSEVQSRGMDKKVIPFPAPAQAAPPPGMAPPSRIMVHIGKQRIAFDISCRATVLNPAPGPKLALPVHTAGRKKRKVRRP